MLKRVRFLRWYYWGRWWIKNRINRAAHRGEKIKIIIGSGKDFGEENGWILTNLPHFDITKEEDWKFFFKDHKINNLLAEHVLEHLTETDVEKIVRIAGNYCSSDGTFRIAVPDGFNRDPDYADLVSPAGKMGSHHGHRSLWTYQSLKKLSANLGWQANILEFHNEEGTFISTDYNFENGMVYRSSKSNRAHREVSLIVDCIKN